MSENRNDEVPLIDGRHEHGCGHQHGTFSTPHDWHSQSYVDDWIKRDATRNEERRPRIREMVAMAPLLRAAPIRVLDVGAGYGFVAEEVLSLFPSATVTLQDYSEIMLAHARARLARAARHLKYALCDLTDPTWFEQVGGPFDLVVSALAIHNLGQLSTMGACYEGIARLLEPGGAFLDYDIFQKFGGIETHISLMHEAGMSRVTCAWQGEPAAIIVGYGWAGR